MTNIFSRRTAPDGYPIPPEKLRYLVSGERNNSRESFFAMGKHCAAQIVSALTQSGANIRQFDAILDFGCGCGRTIRHFHYFRPGTLYATDYNPKLTRWCAGNLPFARFDTNELEPPLRYSTEAFDLVYAFSVFTHLPEPLQLQWARELWRVIKPGGFLAISIIPLRDLPKEKQTGKLVVRNASQPGTNACMAYHAPGYVTDMLGKGFDLAQFVESRPGQDFYLFRKSASS